MEKKKQKSITRKGKTGGMELGKESWDYRAAFSSVFQPPTNQQKKRNTE